MNKKLKITAIATSLLIFNACGGKEDAPTIDTSLVQTLDDLNITNCTLGAELLKGGGLPPEILDPSTWRMTLDTGKVNDLRINDCLIKGGEESRPCIQVDPQKPGTGMYQQIDTKLGQRYRVHAELIGADNYKDKNNFNEGSSYISIEDHKPEEKSIPIAFSEKVKGDIPKQVSFDFNATKTVNYVSLRGDTAFRYPTAFFISVKELIPVTDSNSTEPTVPCNLPK